MRSLERASTRQLNWWRAFHSCTKAASDSTNAYHGISKLRCACFWTDAGSVDARSLFDEGGGASARAEGKHSL